MGAEPVVKSILMGTKGDGTLTPILVDNDGNLVIQLEAAPTIEIGDVQLLAGTAIAGKFGIDQTTDGTTNGVNVLPTSGAAANTARTTATKVLAVQHVDAAGNVLSATPVLGAGSAIAGKFGIDQTTPGTTNKVTADPVTATPTIYNVTLTNANTEYSQALPANCRGFEIECQTGVQCRWSNVTGKVATPTAPFKTLQPNVAYNSPPINQGASPSTLYFASATAGAIIELIAWV